MSNTDDETLTTKDRTSKKIGYEMRLAFYDHGDVDMRAASPDALSLLIRVTDSIAKISTGGGWVARLAG